VVILPTSWRVGIGGDGARSLDHREGEGTEDGGEDRKGLINIQGPTKVEGCRPVEDAAAGVARVAPVEEARPRPRRRRRVEVVEKDMVVLVGGVWWWW